jgi:kojibiose phosphorylase/nigerose phosphorylase
MVWEITKEGFDPAQAAELGNRFLCGNGYLGVRGTLEEYGKEQLVAVNLAGIYHRHGDGWREPLNAPNPFHIQSSFDDVSLSTLETSPLSYRQGIDFRHGIQMRDTEFTMNGKKVTVSSRRFASLQNVHLLAARYTVCPDSDGQLLLSWNIDSDVWDIHGPHYSNISSEYENGRLTVCACTDTGEKAAVSGQCFWDFSAKTGHEDNRLTFSVNAKAGQAYNLTMVAVVYTTKDGFDPKKTVQEVRLPEYNSALSAHIAAWEALWEHAEVLIEGDETAEMALNYSMYHLMCIAPRHRDDLSVAARGLSGQTYKGAVFWDTEMFMLDFYLSCLPQSARSALNYRIQTLPGALDKAKQYGYDGAFYAWESQEGGFDACSDYNVTDVFTGRPMRTYFKDKQMHISAAVVYGLIKYMAWTGEYDLLAKGACEVILQCARFYYSLLTKRVACDVWELTDVIGPDEYHERVDNNAYTNEMARFVFQHAVLASKKLKEQDTDAYLALNDKLDFEKDLPHYVEGTQKLKEQKPNPTTSLIEQFDGYFSLEDTTVNEVRSRLLHPKEYWGGAYGVASHTQVIKQADVMTMLYLFKDKYTAETVAANYDYYEPRTEHGSSLSACMYALTACLIGRPDAAYPLFLKSAQADLQSGGKEWAGLVYIGGTHPAAAGGAYMTLLNGFLGLNPASGNLTPAPRLPSHWKRVKLQVFYRGRWHAIDVKA